MSQSQSANEMIQGLTQMKDSAGNPVISTDEAESLYGKSLGARKDLIAEHLLRFHAQYSSAINQQNELERIRATAATAAPYRQAEIVTTGEQQRKTAELEGRLALLKNPDSRLIKNPPAAAATTTTAPTTAAADSVKSPLQKTIDTSKNPKPGTNVLKLFPQL